MPEAPTIERTEQSQEGSADPKVTELSISGMTCANCARHVLEALQSVPGVERVNVSLDAQQASVRWRPATEDTRAVVAAVEQAGFGAAVLQAHSHQPGESILAGWRLNLLLGVPATAILMVGEWVMGLGATAWFPWFSFGLAAVVQVFAGARFYAGAWRQLKQGSSSMDTLVALGSTTSFGFSTWALLTGAGGHLYFMEAAAIITLISAGHWIESRVSVRASSTLRKLLDLTPAMARRLQPDGKEEQVPVSELRPAQQIVLRPGDRVPTDAAVVAGNSVIDESMLTGESLPVEKSAGSQLYAGTINSSGRLVARVTATGQETALAHIIATVERAQVSRANIQRLADKVSNVFVPIVVAIAVAAGLWWGLAPESARHIHELLGRFLWHGHVPASPLAAAFIISASVLIIACPCAMGLATPAAIMAGSNAAAERGILIRDGLALEKAGEVTAVLFDKTGTLTLGKPSVVGIWDGDRGGENAVTSSADYKNNPSPWPSPLMKGRGDQSVSLSQTQIPPASAPVSKDAAGVHCCCSDSALHTDAQTARMLQNQTTVHPLPSLDGLRVHSEGSVAAAAALAAHSTHPLSQAIAAGGNPTLKFENLKEIHGSGIEAQLAQPVAFINSGSILRLGSLRWLSETGADLAPGQAFIEKWSAQGASIVGLSADTKLVVLFALKDTLKPGTQGIVQNLQSQGLKTYLITGDNSLTASSIARMAGIPAENVFAEVRPEQKAAMVQKLQQQGERVAFVGDGINDAPALEQADLGIAVSRASDIAREAADIILLKSEIDAVPESLGLARATLRTIRQNLFWAFFYNAIGIPLAAFGFMSPILYAAAMCLSDMVVMENKLRLRHYR